jgi:hypothetical protein
MLPFASQAPSATNPLLSNAYTESYNLNLQQQFAQGVVMEIGYIGSEGKHLRIQRNINQFIYPSGVATRPFAKLSPFDSTGRRSGKHRVH